MAALWGDRSDRFMLSWNAGGRSARPTARGFAADWSFRHLLRYAHPLGAAFVWLSRFARLSFCIRHSIIP